MKNVGFILYVSLLLLFPFAGKAATDPDWSCDIHAYQYDMSVYLSLQKTVCRLPGIGSWRLFVEKSAGALRNYKQ